MNVLKKVFPIIMILILSLTACLGGAPSSPVQADLYIVVGNNASRFTGNGNGDGLLLDQFRNEYDADIFVQVANDRDHDFREQCSPEGSQIF
jgi:hypothetical protein